MFQKRIFNKQESSHGNSKKMDRIENFKNSLEVLEDKDKDGSFHLIEKIKMWKIERK